MKIPSIALLTISSVLFWSCSDKDVYDSNAVQTNNHNVGEANNFDFSTVQDVSLTVDYSAFQTYGQVFFSVYSENPFVEEGDDQRLDERVLPIFESFTDATGKFNHKVQLPAYAEHLYVVTGNFLVSQRMMEADVLDGAARAVAVNSPSFQTRAGVTRAGVQTNDLSTMPQLSYLVNEDGTVALDADEKPIQIYKEWSTPLGTWDSQSGAPNYIIKPGEVRSELLFTEDDIEGLYRTIGQALDANKACSEEYRNFPDLTLEKESEVTITMLGGSTCWNSSLGYYYYFGDEPQRPEDLNIIMLFPNTQDGHWARMKSNYSYNGNIGVNRGDAVLLKYYPNIASGSYEGATTIFPVGIKIGFILKANGWAMQGKDYTIKGLSDSSRKYNVWGASTPGASYCLPFGTPGKAPYQYPNPNGESRSAKFAYTKMNGDQEEKFAIVSFEDACNDQDYDDVIFALKPVNAFTPLPEVEEKKTTTVGIYAFEDLWPSKGDYDLNDVVVDCKHERSMSRQSQEEDFKIYQETFYLTTYQNYVELVSGLAFTLLLEDQPSSIVMKKQAKNSFILEEVQFPVENNVYYLTSDVSAELGTTYILELNYDQGLAVSKTKVLPFIYRNEEGGKTWEVHVPFEAPTGKMRMGYFKTDDDASDPATGKYFLRSVSSGNFPFAFYLANARIDKFKETILVRKNESRSIDTFFEGYEEWAVTKGVQNKEWYLHPRP